MEWFQLRPNSIAALAELTLSFVLTLYLLSIRKKSRDGWLITAMFMLPTLYHTVAFVYYSTDQAPWNARLAGLQVFILSVITVVNIWFAYTYRQNPFRREMYVTLALSTLIIGIGFYFHTYDFPVTFHIYLLIYAWITLVFMRKAIWAAHLPADDEKGPSPLVNWRTIGQQFRHPANRESKAYRAFALWTMAFLLIWLNVNLAVSGWVSYDLTSIWWALPHHVLLLVRLTWLVISYINFATEHTTFVAKLVGLYLCLTLILLGMLGFLLYGFDSIAGPGDGHVQDALVILAFLIPASTFIIVLIIPIFFRINLLRPLNYVLDGVQRVNAGDLNVKVPIEVRDEIGTLGHHFNRMTGSLRRYSQEMESLVRQRTQELEHQKAELQAALENLKATQDQLIQKEKMASLGELTAGIAHEIQNPLNFVNNFSEVSEELVDELEQELGDGQTGASPGIMADLKQILEKIQVHGKRAESIVKGMLQHSRAANGEKQLTDLNALADEYLRLSYHGLRAKDKSFNAQMVTDFDQKLGLVEVVPQEIGRVLLNLFNNAFFATQEKKNQLAGHQYQPEVRVATRRFAKRVEIRVKDNGVGIPAEVLDKIFQPFFTTKAVGEGTGLGLSLSYDIVTKGHGGELKVETKEGEFSEFIVILPV